MRFMCMSDAVRGVHAVSIARLRVLALGFRSKAAPAGEAGLPAEIWLQPSRDAPDVSICPWLQVDTAGGARHTWNRRRC